MVRMGGKGGAGITLVHITRKDWEGAWGGRKLAWDRSCLSTRNAMAPAKLFTDAVFALGRNMLATATPHPPCPTPSPLGVRGR